MNPETTTAREAPDTTRTRRGFLRDLTLGSLMAATAATVITSTAEAQTEAVPVEKPHPGTIKLYRFRTRNTVSCRACRLHHRYMVFRTRKIARKNRAHPGCDCPIEPQWIERKTYRLLFKHNGVTKDVANLKPTGRR
ncbi:twin-arginine translocation signal domain-containing protein [Candidatus Binatia bacterium]|nr:twin-arginine translocation signal domain-containing protein [Candidatus Binatia bacterium]